MIIIEVILEFLAYIFVEILFRIVILGIFKIIYWTGVLVLKIITFNKQPLAELFETYKDSALPYFIGTIVWSGFIYLTITIL